MLQFLQKDMDLQLQLLEETKTYEKDLKALLNAGMAIEYAHKQQRTGAVAKEIEQAQAQIQEALGLKKDVYQTQRTIDAELQKLDSDIASVKASIVEGERKLAPKQAKSDFAAALERVIQQDIKEAFPTKQTKDALLIAWGDRNTEIEDRTARLNAIPGERISFEQRREMLELVRTGRNTMDEIDNDIVEIEGGLSMTQAKLAADRKEVIELGEKLAKLDPFSLEADQTRTRRDEMAATIVEREKNVEQFQKRIEKLERDKIKLQKAYDKAVAATSSDPEIASAVTASLQAAEQKKIRLIQENFEAIKAGKDAKGKPLSKSALEKKKVRMSKYQQELNTIRAKISNRLGIERIDVTTDKPVAPTRASRAGQEQQLQMEEASQREEMLRSYRAQMQGLTKKLEEARANQRAPSTLQRIQRQITKLQTEIDAIAPKPMGKVSQLSREQSSAPGKFRTGTQESKNAPGIVRQPVVEKRTVRQPTSAKAIKDANTLSLIHI